MSIFFWTITLWMACRSPEKPTTTDTTLSVPDDSSYNQLDTSLPDTGSCSVDTAEGDSADDSADDSGTSNTDDCTCASGLVFINHECAPTTSLGCNEGCDVATGCSDTGYICDDCAASSTCDSDDCLPACILQYAPHVPVTEPLRISITKGPENTEQTLNVQGTPFYVGAIGHRFRFADEEAAWVMPISTCTAEITIPARPAGLYPIWISQYSSEGPWILSGFYHSGIEEECLQPGMSCNTTGTACCETPEVPTTCQQGYCLPLE